MSSRCLLITPKSFPLYSARWVRDCYRMYIVYIFDLPYGLKEVVKMLTVSIAIGKRGMLLEAMRAMI